MKKICFLFNIPTPYRRSMFQHYRKFGLEFDVYYCGMTEDERSWEIGLDENENKLIGISLLKRNFINFIPFKLIFGYDIVFAGGWSVFSILIVMLLRYMCIKKTVFVYDGGPHVSENFLKRTLLKFKVFLLKHSNMPLLVNGSKGRDFFVVNGIHRRRIYNQFMTVDIDFIHERRYSTRFSRIFIDNLELVNKTGKVRVLFVGRLSPGKGIQVLLEAIDKELVGKDVFIIIAGDGVQRKETLRALKEKGVENIYMGHLAQHEIYELYRHVDLLVLPSEWESWGLVVNEAMASELPVLVSKGAGAAWDLVYEGKNGYTFAANDVDALSRLLIDVVAERTRLPEMGKTSWAMLQQDWGFKSGFDEIQRLLADIVGH